MIRRLYRALLRLYPAELRHRFGAEMEDLFEVYRGQPWFLARDFLTSVARARFETIPKVRLRHLCPSTLQDARIALRGFLQTPGFTVVAVSTIALGIGANTAIFSVVNGVVLKPLPYHEPDRLVTLWSHYPNVDGGRGSMSLPDIRDVQRSIGSFEAVAAYAAGDLTLTGMGEPEVIPGARVTTGLLRVFDLVPELGRDLRAEENVPGGPRVVVIGYSFWQSRFGGRTDVIGETLHLSGETYEIVGVAPAGFAFPRGAELWRPRYLNVENCGRGCHSLRTVARLEADGAIERAREELSVLASNLSTEYSDTNTGKVFIAEPLSETLVGRDVRTALYVLLGAVGVVLLIASGNVAHLMLARASARGGEIAVRTALGASRFRVVRQLFVESLVLALTGGGLGIAVAYWLVQALLALAPTSLPRLDEIAIDGSVLLFAVAVVLGANLLFGLAPAFAISRNLALACGRIDAGRMRRAGARTALLTAEVALSLVLLFGAGLLTRSFWALQTQDLGFDRRDVLTFTLSLPGASYDPDDCVRLFALLEERLEAIPAVEASGAAYGSPMGRGRMSGDVTLLDRPVPPPGQEDSAIVRAVTPGYIPALRAPLLSGRNFEASDHAEAPRVALVNESFANRYYPGRNVLGERIRLHVSFGQSEKQPRTIVGVVRDVRARSVSEPATPEVWAPQAQMASSYLTVLVRSSRGVDEILGEVRATVRALDSELPLRNVETLSAAVDRSIGSARFYFALLVVFASLALLLASVGLYGVLSYIVSQRNHEIGLRVALGAKASDIVRMVVAEALTPTLAGVGLGLLGSVIGSRLLQSMLYAVEPLDPATLVATCSVLAIVGAAALALPAKRACRVSPSTTLRQE